ncbi:MAG: Nudix family hydrolase [Gammaproteobacteria bacterium]|nr:MAG: Nudix family hydrolase [Gammaproteobacteria bacterium]
MSKVVHVAVGVIVGADGNILIAKRPDKTHQGGLWEFPGGKVEENESLFEALKRELHEELAIQIAATEPLIKIRHDYGDKIVLLDVHKVTEFSGEPKGNEGQPIVWVNPNELRDYEFPAANQPIITAIQLPQRLLVTGKFNGVDDFLTRIEDALKKGIRLVQLRMNETEVIFKVIEPINELCNKYSAGLLVNTSPSIFAQLKSRENIGLHLNSRQLFNCQLRPVAENILLSASCHNQSEIEQAEKIGVDFIYLSPVLATKSHPHLEGIGWELFSQLVENTKLPVYALGGMKEKDLEVSVAHGAQGIAAISEWW